MSFFVSIHEHIFGSSEDCTVEGAEKEHCWGESVTVCKRVESGLEVEDTSLCLSVKTRVQEDIPSSFYDSGRE